jgi:hypothetical protein
MTDQNRHDFSMGVGRATAERPQVVAWRPGEGRSSRPVIDALRSAGVDCWIGARREPPGNFEVSCLAADLDRVRELILQIDSDAAVLTRGR